MSLPVLPAIFLGYAISKIVFRVLALISVGVISYTGIDPLISSVQNIINSRFSALPPELLQLMGVLNVDKSLSILLSAFTVYLTIRLVSKIGFRGK